METWRLITTWGADPAFNMGLDEALLESAEGPPTLRFYSWRPDTLSLGYFQRFSDVPGVETAGAVVRRITGGGAIHHVKELTFSIAASLDHPLYRGPIADSYTRVHEAIRAALAEVGVPAEIRGARDLVSDRTGTGMCFHKSSPIDLVWGERKGVGSAQRRKGGRVLHHGSIKLGTSPLEGEIATADEHAKGLTAETFAPILRSVFAKSFEATLEAAVPTPDERSRAKLLGKRYVDPGFVRKRS
jgi:lipoyl(octanoyl) transferase